MIVLVGFIFGAFIGSFLNVCIHRLPRNESIVAPPSRCYSCGTRVQWYDNLPIISYLVLRGRCRWCGASFSPRYLFLELLTGGLTALVMWWAFAASDAASPWLLAASVPEPVARAAAAAAVLSLVYYLVVAAIIDFEHFIIPDELTKSFQVAAPLVAVAAATNLAYADLWDPGAWLWRTDVFDHRSLDAGGFLWRMAAMVLGAIVVLLLSLPLARVVYSRFCPESQRWDDDDHRGFRVGVWWFAAASLLPLLALGVLVAWRPGGDLGGWPALAAHLAQATAGSLLGWMSLYLVGLLGTIAFRRNAMGFGDVKFLAPIGAFLGPVGVVYAFLAAAVIGTAVGLPLRLLRERREIPCGPYLALGALAMLFAGPAVHHWVFGSLVR
jgi:leader peptidase (prepilin peptidase)/N-methyltransferase